MVELCVIRCDEYVFYCQKLGPIYIGHPRVKMTFVLTQYRRVRDGQKCSRHVRAVKTTETHVGLGYTRKTCH